MFKKRKATKRMNKLKTIFIAALFETALVLCVGCANLLLKPIGKRKPEFVRPYLERL